MKLEKREITLNEQDSLKDVFYWEKILIDEYTKSIKKAERKETKSEIAKLLEEAKKDMQSVEKRIE